MTLAAMQFDPVMIEFNRGLNKKQFWMLRGLTTDMGVEFKPFDVAEGDDDEGDDDNPTALVWGVKDGGVHVQPELQGSEAEIKAAVKTLTDVLNAAKLKAQAETKG